MEFLEVHLGVNLVAADFTEVSDGDALASNTRHLNCISECELVVDGGLLVITLGIINDTHVDVG